VTELKFHKTVQVTYHNSRTIRYTCIL